MVVDGRFSILTGSRSYVSTRAAVLLTFMNVSVKKKNHSIPVHCVNDVSWEGCVESSM